MTEKQAQKETRYRLIMILVKPMERDGPISAEERKMASTPPSVLSHTLQLLIKSLDRN